MSSSSPPASASPLSRLYADAARSIFALMSIRDVAAVARCSRQWLAWAAHMHSLRQWAVVNSADAWGQVADAGTDISLPAAASASESPSLSPSLRHHVRSLDCTAAVLELDRFLLFLRSFPQLQRVQVVVAEDCMDALAAVGGGETPPLLLPATLLELRVVIQISQFAEAHPRFLQLLVRLAATAPLLQTFAERNERAYVLSSAAVDLTPLLSLTHLTELVLQLYPSAEQMAMLSTLPAIRRMRFPPVDTLSRSYSSAIQCFGQQPGQLPHCEWLEVGASCTAEDLGALSKVAALTRLPSRFIEDSGLLSLPKLTQPLRRFDFEFDRSDDPDEVHPSPMQQLLQCGFLSSLQHLALTRVSLYFPAENDLLASRLPQLRILQLTDAFCLSALSFLAHLTLLEQCSFNNCLRECRWSDFSYILALPRLSRFHCIKGFPDTDRTAMQTELADPTSAYARFDCFVYFHPKADGCGWDTWTTPRSHCPKHAEFELNPDRVECWCEL